MNKFNEFLDKNFKLIFLGFLLVIFINTCGNPNKTVNKKLIVLTEKIDSLSTVVATQKDLQIEGLRSEKRMIQSTDRRLLDVDRQSEIDKEIKILENK
jgi:hypothetical protein